MGCSASKDSAVTNSKDGHLQADRSMSMPHQLQSSNKSDNGYHVVALTSSTYGILKVETPKNGGGESDRILSKSKSDADAVYEKLKQFDVPENMVSKPWSEVSLALPKIPPATRTDSPRLLPQEAASKSGTETIDMWELMDGLDEESLSSMMAPSKLELKKPTERAVGSPVLIKPFERSITFSTIHTLSELDSGDPNMAIAPGSGNNFMRTSSEGARGNFDNTNTKAFKAQSQVSSPAVRKPDEIVVKLTPFSSSSSPPRQPQQPKVGTQSAAASPKPPPPQQQQQPGNAFRALPPHAVATIKEVSNLLLPPASPVLRPKSGSGSPAGGKLSGSQIPKSPMPKAVKSPGSSSEAQLPKAAAMKEPKGRGVSNSAGNATEVSPVHPGIVVGDQKPLGKVMPTKSPSPPSRGGARNNNVTRQVSSPGRVRAAAAALSSKERLANPQPQSISTRSVSEAAVAERNSGAPHFATPIHVLSLAATYEIESQKDIDLKAPSMSPGPAKMMKSLGGKPHSVPPSPLLKSVSSPGQGTITTPKNAVQESSQGSRSASSTAKSSSKTLALSPGVQNAQRVDNTGSNLPLSHTSPNQAPAEGKRRFSQGTGRGGSPSISRPAGASRGGKGVSPSKRASPSATKSVVPIDGPIQDTMLDPDLLASFEEALEMFSEDDWKNARGGSSGRREEVASISGRREGNVSLDSPSPMTSNVKLPSSPSLQHETRSPMVSSSGGKKIVASNADKAARRLGSGGAGAVVKRLPSPAKQKKVRPDPWERFDRKCPPVGEERVVLYTTSLRGIRKTFEDCNNVRFILQGLNVAVDERDVSLHAEFRQELKDLMMGKPVPVPQVFIKGRYIGGLEEITKLHEDGTLATLVNGLPAQLSREDCDGCGGVRFVPCSDCSGSCKIINECNEVMRCPECNENGLMRCPICY